jgi:hypothetical protein
LTSHRHKLRFIALGTTVASLLLALLATLAITLNPSSATTPPGAQDRVGAFSSAAPTHAGNQPRQSSCTRPGSSVSTARIMVGFCVAAKAGEGAVRSTRFVTTPRGTTFDIPEGWAAREADNGKGIVYQRPGAPGNADSIRIMEPTEDYPNGYFRYYNSQGRGQPLDVNGKPGSPSATHHHEDFTGPLRGWPGG